VDRFPFRPDDIVISTRSKSGTTRPTGIPDPASSCGSVEIVAVVGLADHTPDDVYASLAAGRFIGAGSMSC
jgi:hypothetical protein